MQISDVQGNKPTICIWIGFSLERLPAAMELLKALIVIAAGSRSYVIMFPFGYVAIRGLKKLFTNPSMLVMHIFAAHTA